jgi:hypothetical protein
MERHASLVSAAGSRWFWLAWGAAFLGFPIGGTAAAALVGPIDTVGTATLGGAIAAIGAAQWLVLRRRLPLSVLWVPATAGAMAVGLAIGHVLLGDATTMPPLLTRGLIVGAPIGAAQAALLLGLLPRPMLWAAVVTLGWPLGWAITTVFRVDLSLKWAVFGSSGALTFQLATGVILAYLLRQPAPGLAPVPERGPVTAA